MLRRSGHTSLLHYMLQQIGQFRKLGEGFAMQHTDTEYLGELEDELQMAVLETIPTEKRLRGLPAEERLRGLSPDEVLRGFTPEGFARGLSKEEAARLREQLDRWQRK